MTIEPKTSQGADQTQSEPVVSLLRRRDVVVNALLGVAAIPVASLFVSRTLAAAPPLSEQDPQAKALGYVGDANKVDVKNNPTFKPGQTCANCLQITGSNGEALRPCNLFPGKTVAAAGWCKAWVKK
jgi:hypothetical protein